MIHAFFLTLFLALSGPALAEPPSHGEDSHEGAHGDDAHGDDAHGDDAHGDDAHGDEHHGDGHHAVDYWADPDLDGVPSWLDSYHEDEYNEDYQLAGLLFHFFNLLVVIALLVVFARRPILDAVKNRALTIRKELTETARERDEAKQQFEELQARLDKFEDEIDQMRADAAREAAADEAKLLEKAEVEAERIRSAAERTIRDEAHRARIELREDAVELAVKLAQKTLAQQVAPDDHQRLARQFLDSLKQGVSADA